MRLGFGSSKDKTDTYHIRFGVIGILIIMKHVVKEGEICSTSTAERHEITGSQKQGVRPATAVLVFRKIKGFPVDRLILRLGKYVGQNIIPSKNPPAIGGAIGTAESAVVVILKRGTHAS